ncbi:hypothetical protein ACLEEZ_01310 [Lonsdalea quercina]|uniref:hypothetical protein n=1 Tax=Lonsdalea quercina TaxID=71657 RepID=UPI0039767D92
MSAIRSLRDEADIIAAIAHADIRSGFESVWVIRLSIYRLERFMCMLWGRPGGRAAGLA